MRSSSNIFNCPPKWHRDTASRAAALGSISRRADRSSSCLPVILDQKVNCWRTRPRVTLKLVRRYITSPQIKQSETSSRLVGSRAERAVGPMELLLLLFPIFPTVTQGINKTSTIQHLFVLICFTSLQVVLTSCIVLQFLWVHLFYLITSEFQISTSSHQNISVTNPGPFTFIDILRYLRLISHL